MEKLFKEFEKKFGFECYNSLKDIMARLYMRIEELTKSRNNWKEKYMDVKDGNKY